MWVNCHIPIVAEMPHGGFKHSGYGKDLSVYGLEATPASSTSCTTLLLVTSPHLPRRDSYDGGMRTREGSDR